MFLIKKYQEVLAIVASIILYFFIGHDLDRANFPQLIFLYLTLFIPFFFLIKRLKDDIPLLVALSILFRLIFLTTIPNLSQDFYRFIWDGRMILEGLNPYISLPETFIKAEKFPIHQAAELYQGMGELNGSHYTNYPPINQLNFLLAAMVSKSNILLAVVALRVQIILADIGIIYFGKKILKKLDLPIHHIFLYALNPFVIIELTGNLHFEPVMLFFLLLSLYFLIQKKWIWTSILLGVSVSVKLIPFLFVPLFYQWFSKKESAKGFLRWIYFGGIVVLVNMLLFLPFFSSDLIHNYTTSVGLWFKNFEFNASIYYILREIGYSFRGWNEIAIIGKIVSGLSILFIGLITFYRENKSPQQLSAAMLIGISFYYFTATTIHPWYIATPVLLCVFTKYRYPVIWSIAIILSYQAYANIPWKENLYIIALEYLIVYGYLIWEISKSRKRDPLSKNY